MNRSNADNTAFRDPFCRQAELDDVFEALEGEECRAVFVTAEAGMGVSTVLRAVAAGAQNHVPVLFIHGVPSLSKIPYGVLAPFLTELSLEDVGVRINVLRSVLQALEERRERLPPTQVSPRWDGPLILMDDANAVDPATAELVASLVLSGAVKLVASGLRRESIPEPLPRLWTKGMAESIELRPLTQEQGHDFCVQMLGGPVLDSASWYFWYSAGGNPLLMNLVLREAVGNGTLHRSHGVWVAEQRDNPRSQDLKDIIVQQVRGLTRQGSEALNIVALSEPIAIDTVRELVGANIVEELLSRALLHESKEEPGQLRLINPIYGEVIRDLLPAAQSRLLHEKLMSRFDVRKSTPEANLRRVAWALASGLDVAEEQLLPAAIFACKLYQSPLALRLAEGLLSPNFALRGRGVKARAMFNLGDYDAASGLLEISLDEAQTLQELLFGTLLRSATRTALGVPVTTLVDDATALRAAGERLARLNPDDSPAIRVETQERASVLELMILSRQGNYAAMHSLIDPICGAALRPLDSGQQLNRSVALALDAERLTAQGNPVQAQGRAQEAFEIVHDEDRDVFFLPEMIILRHLCAAVCAGNWDICAEILQQFSIDASHAMLSFGGGSNVVLGMALIRQGMLADALATLLPGMDALAHRDPQQLLGFCTSMAFYASAKLGQRELAQELAEKYSEKAGLFVVAAHERAFMAAGREYLSHDRKGLATLLEQGEDAQLEGSALLELNALYLVLELGETSTLERFVYLASRVEGPWAAALKRVGLAIESADVVELFQSGEWLLREGWVGLAQIVFTHAASVDGAAKPSRNSAYIRKMIATTLGKMGTKSDLEPSVDDHSGEGIDRLTKREQEIIALAAAGRTDRDIAVTLQISVRTVEGHLYRAYSKLGINGRNDLSDISLSE